MLLTGALISGGISLVSGFLGMSSAKKRERAAAAARQSAQRKLTQLENTRQNIINPFGGATNLSGMATDLSAQLTNNMANLGVATQAAEIQIEQADISLANTLDTIRSTGGGAGGATALAQAALQSKKSVSANIEQQEAQNEKLRAQGENQLQAQRMQEQQRIQGINISEGQRMQGLDAQGKAFVFGQRENRETEALDRVSAQLYGSQARESQASSDSTSALTGMVSGLGSIAGSYMSSQNALDIANIPNASGSGFTDALSNGNQFATDTSYQPFVFSSQTPR